jgi:hypothetical protein
MMMEAACTCQTSTYFNKTAQRNIPEVCHLLSSFLINSTLRNMAYGRLKRGVKLRRNGNTYHPILLHFEVKRNDKCVSAQHTRNSCTDLRISVNLTVKDNYKEQVLL